ncbi:hypothetical protein F4821DRAFT_240860 [Hypoxylon rubiginosum]|uniref:Uncharacterized protein n=1 Tax=Hypoxylon rubiginosum TaxID=110542 RepID=A0ACC0CY24_9PEZI|nr:hypothetical protein F4821DRAFT_240860 [Hypoxylon rubiginosum]
MATDWNKLKVVDLKAELKRLGLPQNGLKADLVARLEALGGALEEALEVEEALEAAADEDDASQPQDELSNETQDAIDEPQEQQESAAVQEAAESTHVDSPTEQAKAEAIPAAQDISEPTVTEIQAPLAQPSSDATSPQPAEVIQDSQKRKRRSLSPAPSAHEVARKRAKQDEASEETQVVEPIPDNVDETEVPKAQVVDETQALPETEADSTKDGEVDEHKDQNGHIVDIAMTDAQPTAEEPFGDKPPSPEQPYTTYPTEVERDVEPSIHPATSALYIKNFMRPLRPQAVQDHLLDLATPVGTPIDESAIVDFYLDTIRTHAFVVFSTISAASRVRTTLHNRIWPDETNRKALWVDFMPPERFGEWVNMEQASTGGRGATNRYEVTYLHDDDGNLTVSLEEFDNATSMKQDSRGPAPEPERKPSIPTGPSRPFPGIEGAPTGPRGFQANRGAGMHSGRMTRVDQSGLPTRAFPTVSYQPVSEDVARRRLDAIAAAKTKYEVKDYGKEFKRYYFENGDLLVDRGPEIFLGIRPPHRERERQRERGRERFSGRGARGGGGGGGGGPRRNGGMPIFHGVPKGGDRFRPGGSSASGPNSRSRYADDRGSRHNGYSRRSDDRGSRRDGYSRY